MIEYLGKVVATIHQEDPNGEAARYDSNHDGSQTLKNVVVVNTEVLAEMCATVSEWMNLVLGYRLETVAQLRQVRGE